MTDVSDPEAHFKRVDAKKPSNIFVAVWSREKVGKTHFALTFPDPIYFCNFDMGVAELLWKFPNREIYVKDYISPKLELDAEAAETLLTVFLADVWWAVQQKSGTIVIDTGTVLWQIIQKVRLDEIKKKREAKGLNLFPYDYADANGFFEHLILRIKGSPLNLVVLHRAGEQYNASGNKTGKFEMHGHKGMPYLAQVVVHLVKDGLKTKGIIESCRFDRDVEGADFENITYEDLKEVLLGG